MHAVTPRTSTLRASHRAHSLPLLPPHSLHTHTNTHTRTYGKVIFTRTHTDGDGDDGGGDYDDDGEWFFEIRLQPRMNSDSIFIGSLLIVSRALPTRVP